MTRFDREEDGTVDLVDIFGNAKIYYEQNLLQKRVKAENTRLKAKYTEFARAQRQARINEKAVINKLLSSKIEELELNLN